MEFFNTTHLAVPLSQVMLLLALSTIILLIGKIRVALVVNYGFVLYWSYIFNGDMFNSLEKADMSSSIYMGFGLGIILFAIVGFVVHSSN